MQNLARLVCWLLACLAFVAGHACAGEPTTAVAGTVVFVPNSGQAPESVRYVAQANGLRAFFRPGAVDLNWHGMPLRVEWIGADPGAPIAGLHESAAKFNFLTGWSPAEWRIGVRTFAGVQYEHLYAGVNLIYTSAGPRLKSEFHVAAGADPSVIRFRYVGGAGAELDRTGALVVRGPAEFREAKPEAFQDIDGRRVAVEAWYELASDGVVSISLGHYDRSLPLIIDPTVSFSTYLGGHGFEAITAIAVDSARNVYVGGWTESPDFPVSASIQSGYRGSVDGFIAKLDASGRLLWATYLGGRADDRVFGLAATADGRICAVGRTASRDFPIANAFRAQFGGGVSDAFVACLDQSGSRLRFSTFIGGADKDEANGIAADAQGNIYIAGASSSRDFPVWNAFQTQSGGLLDAFLLKLNNSGKQVFSTYLGGAGNDSAAGVALNSAGEPYITGFTFSSDFPVCNPLQPQNGGGQDAFIAKFSAAGNALLYSTYLGGAGGGLTGPEAGASIAVDRFGNAYVAGTTNSPNFPVVHPYRAALSGAQDAFAAKLNPAGTGLVYCTYIGGSGPDQGTAIVVDDQGAVYMAGYTLSTDFPTTRPIQPASGGDFDGFVISLGSAGDLLFASYMGGSGSDAILAIAYDTPGFTYVGGQSSSSDVHLVSPVQPLNADGFGGILMKLATGAPPAPVSISPSYGTGTTQTFTATYSDSDGATDIDTVWIIVHTAITGAHSCFVTYHQPTNSLYLVSDDATTRAGPLLPGNGTASNSQCTLNAARSSVTASGNNLVLRLALDFSPAYAGTKYLYTWAMDRGNLESKWWMVGTWTIDAQHYAPVPVSASPASGNGSSQTFTLQFSDGDGYGHIDFAWVVVNSVITGAKSCLIAYYQPNNTFYLADDSGAWLQNTLSPGSGGSLQNSQCILSTEGLTATGAGNILTLNLPLAFKPVYEGQKYLYAWGGDRAGLTSAWWMLGKWTVGSGSHAPVLVSLSPQTGSGGSRTFSAISSDGDGYAHIDTVWLIFNTAITTVQGCVIGYYQPTNTLYLASDAGVWLGPVVPGGSGTLRNSQCSLNASGSSVAGSGNTLSLSVAVDFNAAYAGAKSVFAWAVDRVGLDSGWKALGSWTVTTEP